MNRIITTLILTIAIAGNTFAQQRQLNKEQFRTRQKNFITRRAALTEAEANKFFQLYYELQDKKQELNKNSWSKHKVKKDVELSDAEYCDMAESVLKNRIKLNEMELEYFNKYKTFLPGKKIFLIQKAEIAFNREILKGNKNNKPHKNNNRKK